VAECSHNHLNPNVLYRLLGAGVLCFLSFFFQFATSFLSAVRWGRQALWLVLVVRWLFERPDNVLDYEAWAITFYPFLYSTPGSAAMLNLSSASFTVTCPFINIGSNQSRSSESCWFCLRLIKILSIDESTILSNF